MWWDERMSPITAGARPRVLIAGLGDTGVMIATRLSRHFDVVAVTTRPALLSGQELGTRVTDPQQWRRTYFVPLRRFRRLDRVRVIIGRIDSVDFDTRQVRIHDTDGRSREESYDYLVIATGVTNGFWRHDRVQTIDEIEAEIDAAAAQLGGARTVAVVGGGATGVSVADNLAKRTDATVHLFHSGEQPLPGYHPSVRRWMARRLAGDGVVVHPEHRAVVPEGFAADRLTTDPIEWSTGQPPFTADVVLWSIGAVRPHTSFLPAEILDEHGFVRVDEHLQVPGHPEVFAVGDVAASDPLRSSARNWGARIVTANVQALGKGRAKKLRTYRAPEYRWGSILGLQPDGLVVAQANGKRVRFPRWIARPLLFGVFVMYYLYGGIRRDRHR